MILLGGVGRVSRPVVPKPAGLKAGGKQVQQFMSGFIVALLVVVGAVALFLRKKTSKTPTDQSCHSKQLEELGRLTGELAHEIKNPLSTIKINLKLVTEDLESAASDQLSKSSFSETDRKRLRALRKIAVIEKETDRLQQILDGFLRYIDKTQLQLATVDINEIVSDMVDFYQPQAHSHSIKIRHGLCNEPLVCKVDVDMLKQLILNLFINAQQAMSDGGDLMIRTTKWEKQAQIQISDTGCGIEADKLPHIFEAYYSSRPQGSGLGLPTAKKIVEAHHGTLSVDSELEKGTLFTITLPLHS